MDDIIEKTKKLINSFEESTLINNLENYKFKVLENRELLTLIKKYNKSNDDYEKISLKREIYKDENYKMYMKYYNDLFFYVLKINSKYKKYLSSGGCQI